jgi:hypothetical protein
LQRTGTPTLDQIRELWYALRKLSDNEFDTALKDGTAIAGDQRLVERSHGNAPMPKHWTTLYELHQLDDTALEKALSNGKPWTLLSIAAWALFVGLGIGAYRLARAL